MKIKTLLTFILIGSVLISCNGSSDLGGYRENYSLENGSAIIDTIGFKDFVKEIPQ
ncbi:hypothetical protein [Pedobacter sp. MW01-1-1]|uniref:hypothetical protein n=1 Tax=Pedobacter sp. MW01-1-1 TaxID=3383027 RepID=UPI003FEF279F